MKSARVKQQIFSKLPAAHKEKKHKIESAGWQTFRKNCCCCGKAFFFFHFFTDKAYDVDSPRAAACMCMSHDSILLGAGGG